MSRSEIAPETGAGPGRIFRMPWTSSDNAMSWLEPTRKCNITCDACFTANDPSSEKPLSLVEREIRAMRRLRRSDGMFIAGGEPLTHSRIADIVRLVRSFGYKPVLVTNGLALTPALLADLKAAGAFGFTFHVDSHQTRPGWTGKSEEELNALRQSLADMVLDAGGLSCGFNITVFPDSLGQIPAIVAWVLRNPDRVHSFSMTAVRLIDPDMPFDAFVGGRKLDLSRTIYYGRKPRRDRNLMSADMLAELRRALPGYAHAAFIGGTCRPDALKLAMGSRIGTARETFGYVGPRTMEILQFAHHWLRGTYLAFPRPRLGRSARLVFLLAAFDREVRRALGAYARAVVRRPATLFRRVYVQSFNIEQAFDILPNGEQDHCDGCPNKTLWQDRLVPACLLDAYRAFGSLAVLVPKTPSPAE